MKLTSRDSEIQDEKVFINCGRISTYHVHSFMIYIHDCTAVTKILLYLLLYFSLLYQLFAIIQSKQIVSDSFIVLPDKGI